MSSGTSLSTRSQQPSALTDSTYGMANTHRHTEPS